MTTAKHEVGEIQRTGATIYVLNAQGVNRWTAHVQPGFDDSHKRISDAECEAIAESLARASMLIAAAPDLLTALDGLMALESRGRIMPIGKEWDAARAAIAKATGSAA